MALTNTACLNAKPKAKPFKLSDEKGLYLEVAPNGSKWWRSVSPVKLAILSTCSETAAANKGPTASGRRGQSLNFAASRYPQGSELWQRPCKRAAFAPRQGRVYVS